MEIGNTIGVLILLAGYERPPKNIIFLHMKHDTSTPVYLVTLFKESGVTLSKLRRVVYEGNLNFYDLAEGVSGTTWLLNLPDDCMYPQKLISTQNGSGTARLIGRKGVGVVCGSQRMCLLHILCSSSLQEFSCMTVHVMVIRLFRGKEY